MFSGKVYISKNTMRTAAIIVLVIFSFKTYSQDTVKVRQVDSLVNVINNSNFKTQRDTLKQNHPEIGFLALSYLTMVTNGDELIKYVNSAHTTSVYKETTNHSDGENTFYFDHNKLIKVEEFMIVDGKKMEFHWYYADDKPIYNTLKSDKGQERAEMLLTIAKAMVDKFKQMPKN
jgi:hypothetical protein